MTLFTTLYAPALVYLPKSYPDRCCAYLALGWGSGFSPIFAGPHSSSHLRQVKGCLLCLLPGASLLPASSFPSCSVVLLCASFSFHHTGCGSKYTLLCWTLSLQVSSTLGPEANWDKSQHICAFPRGGWGWTLGMHLIYCSLSRLGGIQLSSPLYGSSNVMSICL